MTVTPAIVKDHVETDASDTTLQRLIADAVAAIAGRCGDAASVTRQLMGNSPILRLDPPVGTLTSVTEIDGDNTETVIDNDDVRLLYGGRVIEREDGGYWGYRVRVAYTPVNDAARRDRVTIDLVRLSLTYSALSSEGAGDFRASHVDYQRERTRLISELVTPWLLA